MPSELYDSTHAYDTSVPYDGSWGTLTNTPTGLLAGSMAYVEIKCLPDGVALADGAFIPFTAVIVPNQAGSWAANLAENAAFNNLNQYYQIQEVFYDGHRKTYKVRIPSTGGPNF